MIAEEGRWSAVAATTATSSSVLLKSYSIALLDSSLSLLLLPLLATLLYPTLLLLL
jgi:hypothetical protein